MTPYIDPSPNWNLLIGLLCENLLVAFVAFVLGRITND